MTEIDSSGGLSRRDILRQIGTYLAVTGASCAGCSAAFGQWPGGGSGTGSKTGSGWPSSRSPSGGSYPRRERGPATGSSGLAIQGCALSGNAASAFGRNGIRLLSRSGHQGVDLANHGEQRYLSSYIGNYRPSLAYLDDAQGKNAFATSRDVTGRGSPHGAVLMGVHLMRDLLNRPGAKTEYSNAWSIAAVLAHEWAHIAQFARGVRTRDGRVVGMELMADAISGWYLAKKLQLVGRTLGPIQVQRIGASDQTAAARAVYSLGDTNFTSRNHHGTSEQRVGAFVAGHNMGMQGGTFEHVFRFGQSRFVRH